MAANIGKVTFEPLAKNATETIKSIIESLNELIQGEGFGSDLANGLLKGLRNTLAGPGAVAAFYTLFKLIQNSFTYITQALPQIAGITTESQKRQNVEAAILQIMQQQSPIAQALLGTTGNQTAQAQLLLQLARQQTAEYQQQTALAKQLAGTLVGQGVTAKGQSGLQVTRAGGFIPSSVRRAEMMGARAGGYVPGAVVNSPVGGVMNSAENVRYIPGFAQPFINPPIGSAAGQAHRQNSITRTGVDPYKFGGFIPNFAAGVDLGAKGKQFERLINLYLTNEESYAGSALLDFPYPTNAITSASIEDKNKISLNRETAFGDAKITSAPYSRKDLIKKLVGTLSGESYRKLITQANRTKSDYIDLNSYLPVKPSLISSKSSITADNTNAKASAELGGDVILNLSRLVKNPATDRLTADGFHKRLLLNYIEDYVTIPNFSNAGFIPNFAEMSMSQIAAAVRLGRMSESDARAMGWKPTSEKIAERKGRVAQEKSDRLAGITYKMLDIPWKTYDEFGGDTRAYGSAYEAFAINQLKGKYPGILDAISAGLPGGPSSRVDAVDYGSKTFFEMKGGDPTTPAELMTKFKGVRQQLADKYRKELDSWSDILVSNPNWGYASGFIPNFAYKQAVMGLEQNLSGNKAIFDTNPFPHIRNASQPTFSSAIADHGGLSKAMSDSVKNQRAAGLVHGGFIPNFAPMGLDPIRLFGGQGLGALTGMQRGQFAEIEKALAKLRNSTNLSANDIQALSQDVRNYSRQLEITTGSTRIVQDANRELNVAVRRHTQAQNTAATTATSSAFDIKKFGDKLSTIAGFLPAAAGFAEQFIYGNKQRTEMTASERMGQSAISAGATAVGTGAFYGNMILPGWGAAIGAGVGAIYGWIKAVDAAKLTAEELTRVNQENANKIQENITSANTYIEAQKNLSALISSGASQDKIKLASLQLVKSFSEIKDAKLQEIFNKVGSSAEKMQQELSKYTEEQKKLQSATKIGEFAKGNAYFGRSAEEQGSLSSSKGFEFAQVLYNAGITSKSLKGITSAGAKAYLKAQSEIKTSEGTESEMGSTIVEKIYKERFLKENKSDIEDILKKSNLKEGTDEFAKAYETLGDVLFSPQGIENLKNLTGLEKSVAERLKKNVQLAQQEFSAYEYKRDLMLQNMRYVAETNRLLKSNESERKLKEGVFNFQQELLISIVDPLDAISSKFKFMSSQLKAELTDKLQEININYVKENYDKINGLISDKDFISSIVAPAFEKAKKGNFSEMVDLTGNETLRTKYPEALSQIQGSLESRRQTIRDTRQDNERQQKVLEQDQKNQIIKQQVSKTQYNLLKSEMDLVTQRQRLETERKANLDLEINVLERQMGDEARYLGRGVVGSAVEKARLRTGISNKKIAEEERTKSMSSESDLNDIYLMQRQNFLVQAANAKSKNNVESQRLFESMAADVDVNKKVTNLESLRQEIQNLQSMSFANPEQDTKRLKTLQKLQVLEQDIVTGKKKEADLVKGINADELEIARRSTSFSYGMKQGIDDLNKNAETLGNRLGREIPNAFADGMTNALMEVAKGTKSIGDAFTDMAINFGQMIMNEVMKAAIGRVVGSAFTNMFGQEGGSVANGGIGYQRGGMIYAQNGMYISGGRTGDKNPAMLEDGEYVLNRNAVKAFGGPKALDRFNFSGAPRFGRGFQEGGGFSLAPELNTTDYTGNQLYNGVNAGAIDASNFTAYAYGNDEYFTKQREKAIQDEQARVQKEFAKKQKTAQLVSSIVGAVGSMALAHGMSMAASEAATATASAQALKSGAMQVPQELQAGYAAATKSGAAATSKFLTDNASKITLNGQTLSSLNAGLNTGLLGTSGTVGAFSRFGSASQMQNIFAQSGFSGAIGKAGFFKNILQPAANTTAGILGRHQLGGYIGYNSGGFVPHGSRLSDTIPALLTGGEYVMNNSAVRKYGLGTMNMMNAGAFQAGGSNSTSSSNTNNTNNNATNISINVDRSGNAVYGANTSSYETTDIMFTKKMAKQINNLVVRSMSNEKRYGGELYKNPLRT